MKLSLNGQWKMRMANESKWLTAHVPGSVFNDLLNHHKMEDPFFLDNEYKTLKLFYTNETLQTHEGMVTYRLLRYDGTVLLKQTFDVSLAPMTSSEKA